jgi:hypothetical protein
MHIFHSYMNSLYWSYIKKKIFRYFSFDIFYAFLPTKFIDTLAFILKNVRDLSENV